MVCRSIVLLLLGITLFSACKEDDDIDTVPPVLTISGPPQGAFLQLPDSITVTGTATDDRELVSLRIDLISEDLGPTSVSRQVSVNGASGSFVALMVMTDVEIRSGTHYLRVTAFDGVNQTREFIELTISEVPKRLKGLIAVTDAGAGSRYEYVSTDAPVETWFTTSMAHRLMMPDPVAGRLYFVSGDQDGIQSYIPGGGGPMVITSAPLMSTASDYRSLAWDGDLDELISINSTGFVNRYNSDGVQRGQTQLTPSRLPTTLIIEGEDLRLTSRDQNGGASRLLLMNRYSFTESESRVLPIEVEAHLVLPNDRQLLIGQDGSEHVILTYDPFSDSYLERRIAGTGALHDAVATDTGAILAYADVLYRFEATSQQLIPFDTPPVRALAYDVLGGGVYAAQGASLTLYNPLTWSPAGAVILSSTIDDIALLYNK